MTCYISMFWDSKRDYSISDLCEKVGISRPAFYSILKSESIPRVDVALRICDYFNEIDDGASSRESFWTPADFWKEV